jgi:heme/copper-type cytochrome/quinol oxidase subunit 2
MRYNATTDIVQLTTEKRRKATTIIPTVPQNINTDIYIRTNTPDRLDKLAVDFYGDQRLWWVIAAANGLGKGTLIVPADTEVRIPSSANAMNILINLNNSR